MQEWMLQSLGILRHGTFEPVGGVAPALFARVLSWPYSELAGNLALALRLYGSVRWFQQLPRALAVKDSYIYSMSFQRTFVDSN